MGCVPSFLVFSKSRLAACSARSLNPGWASSVCFASNEMNRFLLCSGWMLPRPVFCQVSVDVKLDKKTEINKQKAKRGNCKQEGFQMSSAGSKCTCMLLKLLKMSK